MSSRADSSSDSDDSLHERYSPVKVMALSQLPPPRNPSTSKPVTSFLIRDILHKDAAKSAQKRKESSVSSHTHTHGPLSPLNRFHSSTLHQPPHIRGPPSHGHFSPHIGLQIVRPWDAASSRKRSSSIAALDDVDSESDNSDIEIDIVGDEEEKPSPKVKTKSKVSPLDALFEMTSKTFDGNGTNALAEGNKKELSGMFNKSHPPKKRRKARTAFTNQQIYELEKRFLYQKYLTPADRDEIASTLGLSNAQVITWFQNRRAKLKRDLEELKNDVTNATTVESPGAQKELLESMEHLQAVKTGMKK
ncbi:unnamed protein product [Owenia fusiformis]|uniref:Uncharacterized protein n=1 Tax=Owenia fusiformis TaxID=6347 RepID=A0A8J1T830_OWEFU|nr:unnamed protein product [Owenia fusiformis]